ncbi:MAG: right-handed parallel beta-helix repeat-containing protein [Deltaproteobacteria bacterium]|nr:right-handed parallel beta-helix repeat-containing protein [Deltaproteobacteria bacterium]
MAKALATNRPFVKFTGTTDEEVRLNGENVTFLADPGAKLTRSNNGLLLEIRGASQVRIFDLEISGASGAGNPGISMPTGNTATVSLSRVTISNNTGGGISASAGTLTVSQSTISNNAGGGISISNSSFDITNSFIVGNGGAATAFGGVRLDQTNAGTRRFEFNTVSNNVGALGTSTGVVCTLVTQALTLSNNIVFDNQIGGGRSQVGGVNCAWTFSDIGPDTVTGTGNINADPLFVNVVQGNFHIQSASPAKNAADPAATLSVDFDGDARPQGGRRDMGADEAM